MSLKNNLGDREKIMAWEAHRTMGHEQNDIAVLYCVNVGRVNEAITALDYALPNATRGRERWLTVFGLPRTTLNIRVFQ